MIAHLNYQIDKEYYKKIFFDRYDTGGWHKEGDVVLDYWWKVFNIDDEVMPITKDLGIEDLVTKPRFSYQFPNSTLPEHIDQDRIIGINLNLMPDLPSITIDDKSFEYENCLVDVGSKIHCVKADKNPRLVLKYAIRSNWNEMYKRLDKRGLINHIKTKQCNPYYLKYNSELSENEQKYVRNQGSIVKIDYKYNHIRR